MNKLKEKMNLSNLLLEENPLEGKVQTIWIVLDTYQSGEAQFTGASLTKKGAEKLKQFIIDRFNVTEPSEIAQLKIYEVPLDRYFEEREKLDKQAKDAFNN